MIQLGTETGFNRKANLSSRRKEKGRELASKKGNFRQGKKDEGAEGEGADIQGNREEVGDLSAHRFSLPGGEKEERGSEKAEEEA